MSARRDLPCPGSLVFLPGHLWPYHRFRSYSPCVPRGAEVGSRGGECGALSFGAAQPVLKQRFAGGDAIDFAFERGVACHFFVGVGMRHELYG